MRTFTPLATQRFVIASWTSGLVMFSAFPVRSKRISWFKNSNRSFIVCPFQTRTPIAHKVRRHLAVDVKDLHALIRAGWFARGDEKVLEESKEKAARLVCNMIAVNIRS